MQIMTEAYIRYSLQVTFYASVGNPAMRVMLIRRPFEPTSLLTLSDVVEANFTGYARKVGTKSYSSKRPDGRWQFNIASVTFVATDGAVPNTIFGWGLINDPGFLPALWLTELFPEPVGITRAGHGLTINPSVILPLFPG